ITSCPPPGPTCSAASTGDPRRPTPIAGRWPSPATTPTAATSPAVWTRYRARPEHPHRLHLAFTIGADPEVDRTSRAKEWRHEQEGVAGGPGRGAGRGPAAQRGGRGLPGRRAPGDRDPGRR